MSDGHVLFLGSWTWCNTCQSEYSEKWTPLPRNRHPWRTLACSSVIVLSGDRHEFAAVSIRESVIDFCIGPMNQFSLPIRTLSQKNGLCATGEDQILKCKKALLSVISKVFGMLTSCWCLADIPDGYRKFSTFEVDTRNAEQPIVTMKLWIDGREAWNVDVIGKPVYPPVQPGPVTQLGRSLAFSLSELLGFGRRWFWR